MKICILGTAPTSKDLAPFDNKDIEFWVLSQDNPKRADVVFEIHEKSMLTHEMYKPENILRKYPNQKFITVETIEGLTNQDKYPLDEIKSFLCEHGANENYLMSSISYMLAYAIYQNVDEIYLYGVDMIASDEYAYQRSNCEWLIGIAQGKGIKVIIPEQSKLLKSRFRYGTKESIEEINENYPLTFNNLNKRKSEHEKKIELISSQMDKIEGTLICLKNIKELYKQKKVSIEFLEQEITKAQEFWQKNNLNGMHLKGAISEIQAEIGLANNYKLGGV